jgi:uncharacterized glyoxalase superfamily protein PhnB
MAQPLRSVNVVTLFVEDEQRSKEFYERVFDVSGMDEGGGTVIFELENLFLRLLARDQADKEMLGQVPLAVAGSGRSCQLAIFVDDAVAVSDELTKRGASIVFGPVDRAWGVRNVGFSDPDGHVWVLSSDIPE